MSGEITFRNAIDANKIYVIKILKQQGEMFSTDILNNYAGEKERRAVRTALNELRAEGKITTDDHVYMWRGKKWKLVLA